MRRHALKHTRSTCDRCGGSYTTDDEGQHQLCGQCRMARACSSLSLCCRCYQAHQKSLGVSPTEPDLG